MVVVGKGGASGGRHVDYYIIVQTCQIVLRDRTTLDKGKMCNSKCNYSIWSRCDVEYGTGGELWLVFGWKVEIAIREIRPWLECREAGTRRGKVEEVAPSSRPHCPAQDGW